MNMANVGGGVRPMRAAAGSLCLLIALVGVGYSGYGARAMGSVRESGGPTTFDPKHYKGPMGKIVLPYRGQSSLYVQQGDEILILNAKQGVFQAPAGVLDVVGTEMVATDAHKVRWTASGRMNHRLTVRRGATVRLDVGPPFTASIDVSGRRDVVSMDFKLVGRGGDSYTVLKSQDSSTPPGFKVLGKSRRTLWRGSFKYG